MQFTTTPPRLANSLPGSLMNGVISAAISWSAFDGMVHVPLSLVSV